MKNKLTWSKFCIKAKLANDNILIKNTLTGSIITMSQENELVFTKWINGKSKDTPHGINSLTHKDIGILVPKNYDEYGIWREHLINYRNNAAHIFTLYFLPTLQCQFRCSYCFENGISRGAGMGSKIIGESREWIDQYLDNHPEIDTFRLVLFGGEPLLYKSIVEEGLNTFHSVTHKHKLKFWTGLTSNGEYLDEKTANMLSRYNWEKVQITLDGPKDVHDSRRYGNNQRPTFDLIIKNIQMLLRTSYIPKINIRISFDLSNADRVPELIRYLATIDKANRINLSLGLITPNLHNQNKAENERTISKKALVAWKLAKSLGFEIPEEFIVGPWCVAIAKHSAILQPSGALQKCFCTVGRKKYDFGSIKNQPNGNYLKDSRFEHFYRTDGCIKEGCQYLPMCGGGCIYDAIVANKGQRGFDKRFCQKTLLAEINIGLLKLHYNS